MTMDAGLETLPSLGDVGDARTCHGSCKGVVPFCAEPEKQHVLQLPQNRS